MSYAYKLQFTTKSLNAKCFTETMFLVQLLKLRPYQRDLPGDLWGFLPCLGNLLLFSFFNLSLPLSHFNPTVSGGSAQHVILFHSPSSQCHTVILSIQTGWSLWFYWTPFEFEFELTHRKRLPSAPLVSTPVKTQPNNFTTFDGK